MPTADSLLLTHIAIGFFLILPGALLAGNLLPGSRFLTQAAGWPFLAVLGFVLSLAINGALGLAFGIVGWDLTMIGAVLAVLDIALLWRLVRVRRRLVAALIGVRPSWQDWGLAALAAVFFVIMARNGGLIDSLADSWWHMAYANRIAETGSVFLARQHLTGHPLTGWGVIYPPLWHLNLALIASATGLPLPLVWHALAAWTVPLTLAAYYVFAVTLLRERTPSLIATLLFCIVLGGLNAYFRVSPWPANISYIVWYCMLGLSFRLLDRYRDSLNLWVAADPTRYRFGGFVRSLGTTNRGPFALLALAALVVAGLHATELIWYCAAIVFYGLLLAAIGPPAGGPAQALSVDRVVLIRLVPAIIIATAAAVVWRNGIGFDAILHWPPSPVVVIPLALATLLATLGGCRRLAAGRARTAVLLTIGAGIAGVVWLAVDFHQFWALFRPGSYTLSYNGYQRPMEFGGPFGAWLKLPHWEHQLRGALLFSGLSGVALSAWLFVTERSRASVFLFGCAAFALLCLLSPYFYSLLRDGFQYNSAYRVDLLIFHPTILGYGLWRLGQRIRLGAAP